MTVQQTRSKRKTTQTEDFQFGTSRNFPNLCANNNKTSGRWRRRRHPSRKIKFPGHASKSVNNNNKLVDLPEERERLNLLLPRRKRKQPARHDFFLHFDPNVVAKNGGRLWAQSGLWHRHEQQHRNFWRNQSVARRIAPRCNDSLAVARCPLAKIVFNDYSSQLKTRRAAT